MIQPQLHIALLFLGLSHHFLTVFGSAFWLLLRLCKTLTIADPGGVSSSFSISIVGMFGMFLQTWESWCSASNFVNTHNFSLC